MEHFDPRTQPGPGPRNYSGPSFIEKVLVCMLIGTIVALALVATKVVEPQKVAQFVSAQFDDTLPVVGEAVCRDAEEDERLQPGLRVERSILRACAAFREKQRRQ